MKRNFLLCGCVGLMVATLAGAHVGLAAPKDKFAVVNIRKMFDEYDKTKEFDKEFQTEGRIKQEERDAIVHDIRRLKDEQALLSEGARADKQEQIDKKLKELDTFDAEIRQTLQKKREEAVRAVFQDIEGLLERYGERKGYDFLLNDRALLYRSKDLDVTNEVLKELNEDYKKRSKK